MARNPTLRRCEALLAGFEPDFTFEPPPPVPETEYADRVRRVRHEAAQAGLDAVVLHTDIAAFYHASNSYLRYLCDWIKEGVLVVATDASRAPVLLSFFSTSVLMPPPGEAVGVDDIRQTGQWGRETYDRPGDVNGKLAVATRGILEELGADRGRIGLIGDALSDRFFAALGEEAVGAAFQRAGAIIDRMQRVRTTSEQAQFRAAAQLVDLGLQAAFHVIRPGVSDFEIYAAFTFAQMARGGEAGDGCQIGIGPHGPHVSKPYGRIVRAGDLVGLYASNVPYRGYWAQAARMVAVGEIARECETLIEVCLEAHRRGLAACAAGVLVRDVNNAAFSALVERGMIDSPEARAMPWAFAPGADGSPLPVPVRTIPDRDLEGQGRALRHLYPAVRGPIDGPRFGHGITMPDMPGYSVISSNLDRLETGQALVLHAQWVEPGRAGCNIGGSVLITDDGIEDLNCHTPIAPHRVPA
ncbi:MAG: M24 family metallopeptidase [Rhodospirillales bacterium]|nr:M24 family metallopeptidase [Rhodospirillales bacterium]